MDLKVIVLLLILIFYAACISLPFQKTQEVIYYGPELHVEAEKPIVFAGDTIDVFLDVLNNDKDLAYDYVYADIYDTGILDIIESKQRAIHSADVHMNPSDASKLEYPRIVNVYECHEACKSQFGSAYKWREGESWSAYHACKPHFSKGGGKCFRAPQGDAACTSAAMQVFQEKGWDPMLVTTPRMISQDGKENYLGEYWCCCDVSSNAITGRAIEIGGRWSKDSCTIHGRFTNRRDYSFYITCEFTITSGETQIPVFVYYSKSHGSKPFFSLVVFKDMSFEDITANLGITYINGELHFALSGVYIKDGTLVEVHFADKVLYMHAHIEKRNGNPTGKIILRDDNGREFSFVPTRNVVRNQLEIYAFFSPKNPEALYLNGYTYYYPGYMRMKQQGMPTGRVVGGGESGIEIYVPVESGALDVCGNGKCEESETPETCPEDCEMVAQSTTSTTTTTVPKACTSSNECPDIPELNNCGVCKDGKCVPSHRQQGENEWCEKDCQCKEGLFCDIKEKRCKRVQKVKLCLREKRAKTDRNELVTYYFYCAKECVKNDLGSVDKSMGIFNTYQDCVQEANKKMNEYKKLGEQAFVTKTCKATAECLSLEQNPFPFRFDCAICYFNVCVNSDRLQTEGMGCERDCQCKEGRCVYDEAKKRKVCKVSMPRKTTCDDGTPLGECSKNKPKYCDRYGYLWNDCGKCNCPTGLICTGFGTCVEKLPPCYLEVKRLLPNEKKSKACTLIAPTEIPSDQIKTTIRARMRYRNKFNVTQVIEFISKEDYLRGNYKQKPQVYTYRNRDIEVVVEFSEPLPIVVSDKDVYITFYIRNVGNGFVYPLKPEDIEIDQWPQVIDKASCNFLNRVLIPEQGVFPKISCKLIKPKNPAYLNVYLVNINIRYAYEIRKEIEITIRK